MAGVIVDTLAVPTDPETTDPLAKSDLSQAVRLRDLLREGMTVAEAGRALGISRATAFRRLQLVQEDLTSAVLNLLVAKSLDFTEDWVTASQKAAAKGDHRPAKDALIHAKLIEPIDDGSSRTNIAIMIGTPEQPLRIAPPQVVDSVVVSDTPETT